MNRSYYNWLCKRAKYLYVISLASLMIVANYSSTAYNLDVLKAEIFADPFNAELEINSTLQSSDSSYFGYSLALLVSDRETLLLVGAPRANSSRPADVGVAQPGAVYSCPLNYRLPTGKCAEWLQLDPSLDGRIFDDRSDIRQLREHAWLGASIAVVGSKASLKIAVCAPRWKKAVRRGSKEKWYMNGMCYSALMTDPSILNETSARRHVPLMNLEKEVISVGGSNYFYFGMGEVGLSLHLTPDSRGDLILGAPGVFHWSGATMLLDERAQLNPYDAVLLDVTDSKYFNYSDLFGYAVTSGYFYERNRRYHVAGAPRAADLLGQVFIYTFPRKSEEGMTLKSSVKGEQRGEYFGSSLASCDVNDDGRDDLIVGAPLWTKESDEGRIYVLVSRGQIQRISGVAPGGRFGTSVVCLTDLDNDGFADVAVGAPYENDQRGAVYVFNGRSTGLDPQFSQRIGAEDFSKDALRGFGISMADPKDVDGNYYVDLAVGAYLSGHAVILKARPVISLSVNLAKPDNFTLDENSVSFNVGVCSTYDGFNAPDDLAVVQILKIDAIHKRAVVYQNRYSLNILKLSRSLKKKEMKCESLKINLKADAQNLLDPIEIAAEIKIDRKVGCTKDCPVLNPSLSKTADSLRLAYALDCGDDNVCVADLNLVLSTNLNFGNRHFVGSKRTVNVGVAVQNLGEPAYRAQVLLQIPQPILLTRLPSECNYVKSHVTNKTSEVTCNVGNPLRYIYTINIELDMSSIEYTDTFKDIFIAASTQSKENDSSNNNKTVRINFDIDVDIAISGKSYESNYSYFEKELDEKRLKKISFSHIYQVLTFGETPISEASLVINVPTHWRNIEIAQLNQVQGYLYGSSFNCDNVITNSNVIMQDLPSLVMDTFSHTNRETVSEDKKYYLNCSDNMVKCQIYSCNIGPFELGHSISELILKIDFKISSIVNVEMFKNNDIIYYVSSGFVQITQPDVSQKFTSKKPDYLQIATIFAKRSQPKLVAIWIILSSVLIGLILLAFLGLVLYKLGFFNRNKPEDLEVLKVQDNVSSSNFGIENSESETNCIELF